MRTTPNKENLNKQLLQACENGPSPILEIERLIKEGADINLPNKDGATPLYIASFNGHSEAIKALIAGRADVNKATNDGWTPLCIAAHKGHSEAIELLIESGANVDLPNKDGATPLLVASQNGHSKTIEALIKKGATVDLAEKKYGTTPLFVASQQGHSEAIETLIKKGANVDLPNKNSWTPLLIASKEGHSEAIKALIAGGAKVDLVTNYGWTPLLIASQNGQSEAIKALIVGGAKVDLATDGWTPLLIASQEGHSEAIKALIAGGAKVDLVTKLDVTPIEIAVMKNKTEAIKTLFELGADTKCLTNLMGRVNAIRVFNSDKLTPTTLELIKHFTNNQVISLRDEELVKNKIRIEQQEFYNGFEKSRSGYEELLSLGSESLAESSSLQHQLRQQIFADDNLRNYYQNLKKELTNNLLFLKFTLFAVKHFSSSALNRQEIISTALAYAVDKDKTGLTTYPLADVLKSADPEIIRKLNSISRKDSKALIELADNLALEMTNQKSLEIDQNIIDSPNQIIHDQIINVVDDLKTESQSQIRELSSFPLRSKASQQFDSFKPQEVSITYQPLVNVEEYSDQQLQLHLKKMAIFDTKNILDNLYKEGIGEYSTTTTTSEIASNTARQVLEELRAPTAKPKTNLSGAALYGLDSKGSQRE